MTTADWAFVISIISVILATASFIWNVWSKFIYPKPKVRSTIGVMNLLEGGKLSDPFISLSATNYGPGAVTLHSAVCRFKQPLWRKLLRKNWRYGIFSPLHNFPLQKNHTVGPFSGGLPKKLDVGEEFRVYLPLTTEGFDDQDLIDVGFHDTFGRYHWVQRKQIREVNGRIAKEASKAQQPLTSANS